MNVGVRLFLSSAAFGIAIAVAYWLSAHELTGTVLLAIMAFALVFAAGYMLFAERDARLAGDRPNATNAEAAGEQVGTFVLRSMWPFALAVAIALLLIGLVFNVPLAVGAFACALLAIRGLIRESR